MRSFSSVRSAALARETGDAFRLLIDLYWEERQLHCWRILALRPDLPEPYARPGEHREGGTTCPTGCVLPS